MWGIKHICKPNFAKDMIFAHFCGENTKLSKLCQRFAPYLKIKLEFYQNLFKGEKWSSSVVKYHFGRGCEKAHTPGTQASKNLPGPIGLSLNKVKENNISLESRDTFVSTYLVTFKS